MNEMKMENTRLHWMLLHWMLNLQGSYRFLVVNTSIKKENILKSVTFHLKKPGKESKVKGEQAERRRNKQKKIKIEIKQRMEKV